MGTVIPAPGAFERLQLAAKANDVLQSFPIDDPSLPSAFREYVNRARAMVQTLTQAPNLSDEQLDSLLAQTRFAALTWRINNEATTGLVQAGNKQDLLVSTNGCLQQCGKNHDDCLRQSPPNDKFFEFNCHLDATICGIGCYKDRFVKGLFSLGITIA